MREEFRSHQYLCSFATSDGALVALDDPAARFVDKVRVASLAITAGIPTLPTAHFDNGEQLLHADSLTYPIAVKPRMKTAGGFVDAMRVDDRATLVALAPTIPRPVVVQPFVDAPLHAIGGVMWKGRLVAVVHQRTLRTWPVQCGVSSAAETTEPDLDKEEALLRVVAGHDGVFQLQFVGDYLIDINARVYGSLPLAVAAGANLPAIVCAYALGRERELIRARVGVRFRWLDGDARNLWYRSTRASVGPRELLDALLPHRGTTHSVESLLDPQPGLTRLSRILGKRRRSTVRTPG